MSSVSAERMCLRALKWKFKFLGYHSVNSKIRLTMLNCHQINNKSLERNQPVSMHVPGGLLFVTAGHQHCPDGSPVCQDPLQSTPTETRWFKIVFRHLRLCSYNIHHESKKTYDQTFVNIFTRYWPISKILSLAHSAVNLQWHYY